jgi:hypothetical protein
VWEAPLILGATRAALRAKHGFEIDSRVPALEVPDGPTLDFWSLSPPTKALIFAFHSKGASSSV